MNNKTLGKLTGIAFIIGTVAGVCSVSPIGVVSKTNYLSLIAENPNQLVIGGLLVMLMGISCATIACWIYPALSKYHKGLAISAVALRTIEGAITLLSAILLLSLVPIAQDYTLSNSESVLAAGNAVRSINDTISPVLGVVFSAGALMYNIGFVKTGLIPRWIPIWGIVALLMHIIASLLIFKGVPAFSTVNVILNIPIAIQEMVTAVYLIIFGFKSIEATA